MKSSMLRNNRYGTILHGYFNTRCHSLGSQQNLYFAPTPHCVSIQKLIIKFYDTSQAFQSNCLVLTGLFQRICRSASKIVFFVFATILARTGLSAQRANCTIRSIANWAAEQLYRLSTSPAVAIAKIRIECRIFWTRLRPWTTKICIKLIIFGNFLLYFVAWLGVLRILESDIANYPSWRQLAWLTGCGCGLRR